MLLNALRGIAAIAILTVGIVAVARAAIVDAIEYYNASLDHYFYTAYPDEIAALDSGALVGWKRTGLSFKVFDAPSPGSVPVCRFYGLPGAGLDSHFITANAAECNLLMQPPYSSAWLLESADAFEVFLPDFATGQCPAGSTPVHRAWDHLPDSDHRYTPDPTVELAMIAIGYVAEGYGPPPTPTSMCSPTLAGGAPVCSPTVSDVAPYVGTSIAVLAQCTGNPTSYVWTGCTSATGRCTATSMVSGPQTYTVVASNASGSSSPASVMANWHNPPPPPVCSVAVTENTNPPVVGSTVLLTAFCSGSPTSYLWSGCGSATANCSANAAVAGVQNYSVTATNVGGTGPPAFASVNWQTSPTSPPGLCGQFSSYLFTDEGWVTARLVSRDYTDSPGFAWNGVWVVKVTIPANATSGSVGGFTVAEFGGPPTPRQMTVSSVPCDFRPDDPTGNNGPLAHVNSNTATINFVLGAGSAGSVGLTPGQVYFVSVRNWNPLTNSFSCDPGIGRCDAFMDVSAPR